MGSTSDTSKKQASRRAVRHQHSKVLGDGFFCMFVAGAVVLFVLMGVLASLATPERVVVEARVAGTHDTCFNVVLEHGAVDPVTHREVAAGTVVEDCLGQKAWRRLGDVHEGDRLVVGVHVNEENVVDAAIMSRS